MEIEYSSEPNYPMECALLLMRALCPPGSGNDEYSTVGIDDFITEFCALHSIPRAELERMAAPLREVQDYVMSKLTTPRNRLEFFFQETPGDPLVIGFSIAFLIGQGYDLNAMFPDERRQILYDSFFSSLFFGPPADAPDDEAGLIRLLDCANCSDAARWRFLMFSRHAAEYQAEVAAILDEAKTLYLQKQAIWQPLLDETMARLRKNIDTNGIGYINEKYHVEIDGESFRFFPSLMGFNGITLSISDRNPEHSDIMYGVYMDTELFERKDADIYAVCQNCKALGDQKRFEILLALKQGELCGQEIAERTGLSAGTVSHHMNELVNTGFVTLVKKGTRVNYTLSPPGLERFFERIRRLLL